MGIYIRNLRISVIMPKLRATTYLKILSKLNTVQYSALLRVPSFEMLNSPPGNHHISTPKTKVWGRWLFSVPPVRWGMLYSSLDGISKIQVNIPIRSHLFPVFFSINKIFHWMGGSNKSLSLRKPNTKFGSSVQKRWCVVRSLSQILAVCIYIYTYMSIMFHVFLWYIIYITKKQV